MRPRTSRFLIVLDPNRESPEYTPSKAALEVDAKQVEAVIAQGGRAKQEQGFNSRVQILELSGKETPYRNQRPPRHGGLLTFFFGASDHFALYWAPLLLFLLLPELSPFALPLQLLTQDLQTAPLGHASDSTVRPASDSTVRPASNSTATRRSNRSKLKEVALPVDPSKESNDAVCMSAKTKARAKPLYKKKPQKKGLGDERGGGGEAQKAALVKTYQKRAAQPQDIHKEPEKVAESSAGSSEVANRENGKHRSRDSEAAEVAEGLEGLGDEGEDFSRFPADQFNEPLDSEEEQRRLLALPTGLETKAFNPDVRHKAYSEDPGKASKDTEVPSSSESNGVVLSFEDSTTDGEYISGLEEAMNNERNPRDLARLEAERAVRLEARQARAVELAKEQAECHRCAKGKGKEAEAEADDEAEEEELGEARKSHGGPWNDFTRLYSAENPDHGLATVELSEIYRKEKVKASKEGKEGYKTWAKNISIRLEEIEAKVNWKTFSGSSRASVLKKLGKDLSEKMVLLLPTLLSSPLPKKLGILSNKSSGPLRNKWKFMALNLAEADTFEPSIKGWEAYAEANPLLLEDLRSTVSVKLLEMADRVLKQNGVLEGWGKKGWPYVGLANVIYDLLNKDKGVSFRIHNWPSTCPVSKKADTYVQSELKCILQSIVVGFVKGANSRQEGYPLVIPGTILYMEAFSRESVNAEDMEDGNLALVFDQKKNPLLRLWDSTKWRKMDATQKAKEGKNRAKNKALRESGGKSSTVLNIGSSGESLPKGLFDLRIWKMLQPSFREATYDSGAEIDPQRPAKMKLSPPRAEQHRKMLKSGHKEAYSNQGAAGSKSSQIQIHKPGAGGQRAPSQAEPNLSRSKRGGLSSNKREASFEPFHHPTKKDVGGSPSPTPAEGRVPSGHLRHRSPSWNQGRDRQPCKKGPG
ncbi:hypothetical protein BS47DRAFT_1365133 [Hydnum rufescens UP504]|uniref:Uncharacterized protein n=1 Tax=Hydnum rufescens UP504 TaxID=1448309 RepID=A0A9P6AQ86_9AGAM|nr:hypothetical protein BS47DRAFT_1365133 [Hydnum rufescens UP504]